MPDRLAPLLPLSPSAFAPQGFPFTPSVFLPKGPFTGSPFTGRALHPISVGLEIPTSAASAPAGNARVRTP